MKRRINGQWGYCPCCGAKTIIKEKIGGVRLGGSNPIMNQTEQCRCGYNRWGDIDYVKPIGKRIVAKYNNFYLSYGKYFNKNTL